MKRIILITTLLFAPLCHACTGFGAITKTGTIIGKNRDYFYAPQTVGIVTPLKKLDAWHGNKYDHENKFYALTSGDGVSMGVNQSGLTAIEEDAILPIPTKNFHAYKKAHQMKAGTPDGIVLYGVLQNFNTIDEMKPYLSKIFSVAEPDFYQFSDGKKILTVEVSLQKNSANEHPFTYHILSKEKNYFAHTNTYLTPAFNSFNRLNISPNSLVLVSAEKRLNTLNALISNAKVRDIHAASHWFWNTYSTAFNNQNKNMCLNNSIFRSYLQNAQFITLQKMHRHIYGTTSSMIVSNHGNLNNSHIYLKIIDSIKNENDHTQLIKYDVLNTTLDRLFDGSKLIFVHHQFTRRLPVNGICH